MRLPVIIVGIFFFSCLLPGDTTISQSPNDIEIQIPDPLSYSEADMLVRQLNCEISLSLCELEMIRQQRMLDCLSKQNEQEFFNAHAIPVPHETDSTKNN